MKRGLLNNSPLIRTMGGKESQKQKEWKVDPSWLQLIASEAYMKEVFGKFLVSNKASASQGMVSDTPKAYLRGLKIQ